MSDRSGFQILIEKIKEKDEEIERLQLANFELVKRKRLVEVRAFRFELAFESAVEHINKIRKRSLITARINARTGYCPTVINRCVIRSGNVMRIRVKRHDGAMLITRTDPAPRSGIRFGNPKRR